MSTSNECLDLLINVKSFPCQNPLLLMMSYLKMNLLSEIRMNGGLFKISLIVLLLRVLMLMVMFLPGRSLMVIWSLILDERVHISKNSKKISRNSTISSL
jgi:hypothetical protein